MNVAIGMQRLLNPHVTRVFGYCRNVSVATFTKGREGVKWELGSALFWTGKMGFTHWDWDLATGNGMNNCRMGMGFLFFSGVCSNILKQKNKIS